MWFEQFRQDLHYAFRGLWRGKAFVSTTVLTLAVGIGLLTVVFAVFNAYVLRPFAIHDPYRVYQLAWQSPVGDGARFTWHEYQEFRARHDVFTDAIAHRWHIVTSSGRPFYAAFVSGNYFDMLQPRLRLGRPLATFDTSAPGAAPVAVLSDQGWARLFDRDPNVLGRRAELNGQPFEVVGVMRPEFTGIDDAPVDVWLPLTMSSVTTGTDVFGASAPRALSLFARLRLDVTVGQAAGALTSDFVRSARAQTSGDRGRTLKPEDVRADLRSRATPNPLTTEVVALLSPIFVAFGLVLAAACANVSSVMLARAIARHREIGIRLSVGAGRGRIVRQLLTEALVIAAIAGGAGLALASAILQVGPWLLFASLPKTVAELLRVLPLQMDYRVFTFVLSIAGTATLLCALLPALQSTRVSLTDALRGQLGSRLRSSTLRNLLVGSQVTVSLVLLIVAATLARNGVHVAATDIGFDTRDVFSINQRGPSASLVPPAAKLLVQDPQVTELAVTSRNPLFGEFESVGVTPLNSKQVSVTSYVFVSPEYFPLLRLPIVRGRSFRTSESQTEAPVGIISERTAHTLWPGGDPIGQTLRIVRSPDQQVDALEGYSEIVIVGVAKDVVSGFIYQGIDPSLLYLPTNGSGKHVGALLARGRGDGTLRRDVLRHVLERVDRDYGAFEVVPLDELPQLMLYPLRAASWIGTLLSAIALVLSISGLYGVLMYVLSQRTREIGIRMALGATATSIVRLMMRQSAWVVGAGAALGLTFALVTLKFLSSIVRFENVSLLDAWAISTGIACVAAAAAFATYFPARRATRVDPCEALRVE
jgi:putative ABC transport system permease protein